MTKLCLSVFLICIGMSMVMGSPLKTSKTLRSLHDLESSDSDYLEKSNAVTESKRKKPSMSNLIVSLYDENNDKMLDKKEVMAMLPEGETHVNLFIKYLMSHDQNRDGKLNESEVETALDKIPSDL